MEGIWGIESGRVESGKDTDELFFNFMIRIQNNLILEVVQKHAS